jgi:dihydrofolate synthase/folylpolyglutamate synthase
MDVDTASVYPLVRDYLFALRNQGSRYGIERMRLFADALTNPQRQFPAIHVAGSNGKGSVCAMLESIYRHAGYRTGLYTSPHLLHLGERVQVNRQPLQEGEIIALVDKMRPVAEALAARDPESQPSFFELMTAMAFVVFAQQKVDVALIETGLGGRLDASNVIQPELTIITSIALEHTEILGDSLAKIAAEKAGIIKPGVPIITGPMPAEAEGVIAAIARERGAPWIPVREHYSSARKCPRCALPGVCQRWNAAVAAVAVEVLQKRFPVAKVTLRKGLARVEWGGRWQRFHIDGRQLILDATHNVGGLETLRGNLRKLIAKQECKPYIITGMLGEDRAQALLPVLSRNAKKLYLVTPDQPKATPAEALYERLPSAAKSAACCSDLTALIPEPGKLSIGNRGDTIVVTGSIYLLGEVLQRLRGIQEPQSLTFQDCRMVDGEVGKTTGLTIADC